MAAFLPFDEPHGIALRGGQHGYIIEAEVCRAVRFAGDGLRQRALPRLPCALQEHDRRIGQRLQ